MWCGVPARHFQARGSPNLPVGIFYKAVKLALARQFNGLFKTKDSRQSVPTFSFKQIAKGAYHVICPQ
jgi:hypothetical protein